MYVEQLAQRWKHTVLSRGWCTVQTTTSTTDTNTNKKHSASSASTSAGTKAGSSHNRETAKVRIKVPTIQEVLDAVVGMYIMERVGIHHNLKGEVIECIEDGKMNGLRLKEYNKKINNNNNNITVNRDERKKKKKKRKGEEGERPRA